MHWATVVLQSCFPALGVPMNRAILARYSFSRGCPNVADMLESRCELAGYSWSLRASCACPGSDQPNELHHLL